MTEEKHVKIIFTPEIVVDAELAANVLGISLEKADRLLSSPDTHDIIQASLGQDIQTSLLKILQQMVRQKWPSDTIPVRVDCTVALPPLPEIASFFQ